MQGKIICALAFVAILVLIAPADGCKLCGAHQWCSCANSHHPPAHPHFSRSWHVDEAPQPVHLTLPVIQPQALSGLGYGGGMARMGGGNLCEICGGYSRGHSGYSPREDYGGYSRGYSCRCAPRRNRYRYDDY